MTNDTPALAGAGFGQPLRWEVAPERWQLLDDGGLLIRSGARTDMFVSPDGSAETLNAARLCCDVGGDWMLSARVRVAFAATFDAGALLVISGERMWGKLCFEYSPQNEPMVVSVVTRGRSDDCNSFVVRQDHIFLRIARMGSACAFHASTDGATWQLIRHFTIDMGGETTIGLVAQSPTGQGCDVTFSDVRLQPTRLGDIRSGA
jgi:regulation of enolase protein 1 (concanavalin A-like superfamily)